jgi:hypothetical protein
MSLPSGFKTNNEWQKVTLTLDEYTAIGIRFSDAAIDEFSADNMLVADTRAFEILDYTIVTPSPTLADKYGHAKLTATFKRFIHKFKTYSDVYFLKYTDSTRKYCSVGSADYYDTETPTKRGLKNTMPVVIFSYSLSPTEVIGNVVADGAAVAGAKVTLSTEADLVYSGVTAEDGTFDIPVIQSGQDFTLTVTAEGYPTYTATVTVGSENLKVGTIDLTKGTSSIADVAAESAAKIIVNGNNLSIVADANAAVYTLDGKTVYNAYVDGEAQLTLTKGIYVVVINSANGSKSYKIAIR